MLLQGHLLEGFALIFLQLAAVCARQDQHVLAARFVFLIVVQRCAERQRQSFLEFFGQLAAEGDPAVAQGLVELLEGAPQVMGRLVEDGRALLSLQLGQNIPPLLLIGRQKSLEAESSGGHARHGQRRDQRAGSREGGHADPLLDAFCGDHFAGVGDGGCAGVGDDGDILAALEFADQFVRLCVLIIFVIAGEGFFDLEVVEQAQGVARILRRDQVHLPEGLQDALCDVAEIADRGRAEVKRAGSVVHFLCCVQYPYTS